MQKVYYNKHKALARDTQKYDDNCFVCAAVAQLIWNMREDDKQHDGRRPCHHHLYGGPSTQIFSIYSYEFICWIVCSKSANENRAESHCHYVSAVARFEVLWKFDIFFFRWLLIFLLKIYRFFEYWYDSDWFFLC